MPKAPRSNPVYEEWVARISYEELVDSLTEAISVDIKHGQFSWDYEQYIDDFSASSWYPVSINQKQEIIKKLLDFVKTNRVSTLDENDDTELNRQEAVKRAVGSSLDWLSRSLKSQNTVIRNIESPLKDSKWKPIMIDNTSSSLIKMSIPELAAAWYSVLAAIWAVANLLWWNFDIALALAGVSWWAWKLTARTLFWKEVNIPDDPIAEAVLKDNNSVFWYFDVFFAPEDEWFTNDPENKRKRNMNLDFVTRYFEWWKWDLVNDSWKTNREDVMIDVKHWIGWNELKEKLLRLWLIKQDDTEFIDKLSWDQIRSVLWLLFNQKDWQNLQGLNNFNEIHEYIKEAHISDLWRTMQQRLRWNFNDDAHEKPKKKVMNN